MQPVDPAKTLTAKGSRQADVVLDAAIRCLGRDGYAGTSLQRIADEAGVQKRMVLYYFGSREQLMAAALTRIADDFLAVVDARLADLTTPAEVVDAVFAVVREQLRDRGLLAAYLGLVAESPSEPVLRTTLDALEARARAIALEVLDRLEAHGHRPAMEPALILAAARVAAQGLGLEVLQRGTDADLERALELTRATLPLWLWE